MKYTSHDVARLIELAWEIVNSADNTGCSADLTVCSAQPIDLLETLLKQKFTK